MTYKLLWELPFFFWCFFVGWWWERIAQLARRLVNLGSTCDVTVNTQISCYRILWLSAVLFGTWAEPVADTWARNLQVTSCLVAAPRRSLSNDYARLSNCIRIRGIEFLRPFSEDGTVHRRIQKVLMDYVQRAVESTDHTHNINSLLGSSYCLLAVLCHPS